MIEKGLRAAAIAIALLGLVDPPLMMSARTRAPLSVVRQSGPSMELPAAGGLTRSLSPDLTRYPTPDLTPDLTPGRTPGQTPSRRVVAAEVRNQLCADLGADFECRDGFDPALPTVFIGDRYPLEPIPPDVVASTVTVSAPLAPNVRIAGVRAPRAVPPATAVSLDVSVAATGMTGTVSELVVRSAGAAVARVSHTWSANDETWTPALTMVPAGDPPFTFQIALEPSAAEVTAADNRAAVRVEQAPRLRILFLEARPSWASAFVRRALESDPRFTVTGISRASPRAAVRTGAAPSSSLDRNVKADAFDVAIAGGLEAVAAPEISWLDEFMRRRGGAVVLLPDASAVGAVARELMPTTSLRQTLLDKPAALASAEGQPRIDASELLGATGLPDDAKIVARDPRSQDAVVWTVPRGDGLLVFSGAMDAWRYRAEKGVAFDRFWRAAVSALALGARPGVDVDVSPRRAVPGERLQVVARVRRLEQSTMNEDASISARAGAQPIRLWPAAAPGVFTGSYVVDPASSAVTVSLGRGAVDGTASVAVDDSARETPTAPLSWLARTRHGVDVGPADLARLEQHLRATIAVPVERMPHHPMRSAWWLLPFAACLSGEWWLRRRSGRR